MQSYEKIPLLTHTRQGKKIHLTRPFVLKSGRLLFKHVHEPDLDKTTIPFIHKKAEYFFSVYNLSDKTTIEIENKNENEKVYSRNDMYKCFLPEGPILSQLEDEIVFLHEKSKYQNLIFAKAQEKKCSQEIVDNVKSSLTTSIDFSPLGLNQYVFKDLNNDNRLCCLSIENDEIRSEQLHVSNGSLEKIEYVFALSPHSLSVVNRSKDDELVFNSLEKKEAWTIRNTPFEIDLRKRYNLSEYYVSFMEHITEHEVVGLLYQTGFQKVMIFKVDLLARKVTEYPLPVGFASVVTKLSQSPPCYLLKLDKYEKDILWFFNVDKMKIESSFSLPAETSSGIYGIMPDGKILISLSDNKIVLYQVPLQGINLEKRYITRDTLKLLLFPDPLTNIINNYQKEEEGWHLRGPSKSGGSGS